MSGDDNREWEIGDIEGSIIVVPRSRLERVEAERNKLREELENLFERRNDYPTDLSSDPEWLEAFRRAGRLLKEGDPE
jgi:hypothetical protein